MCSHFQEKILGQKRNNILSITLHILFHTIRVYVFNLLLKYQLSTSRGTSDLYIMKFYPRSCTLLILSIFQCKENKVQEKDTEHNYITICLKCVKWRELYTTFMLLAHS